MKFMSDLSHQFLLPALHPQAICVDATLGRGRDTRFFLEQNVHSVIAYEIQPEVFEQTCSRIDSNRFHPRLAGHETMGQDLQDLAGRIDTIIFNFGYDPLQMCGTATRAQTSTEAVRQALGLLRRRGRMALVFYPHPQGQAEKEAVMACLTSAAGVDVMEIRHPFRQNAPSLICVEKMH